MRTAEEIYKEIFNHVYLDDKLSSRDKREIRTSVFLCIKEAMKDAIVACAEKVYESDLTTKAQLKSSLLSLLNK